MVLPEFLSPSKINTFNICPYKYYCHYIVRRPEIKVFEDAALFGQAVHNILVCYYDKITDDAKEDKIKDKIEEAFVEGSDYRIEPFKNTLRTIQNNFYLFELERIKKGFGKPIFQEKTLRAELFQDLPPFEGIVDAFFEEEGLAVDWKSGKYEEMTSERMIQGKIYEMLLSANGYPVKKILFNNLTVGRQITLPKINDGWVENVCIQMVDMIKNKHFPKKKSGLCEGYCEYILSCDYSGVCPWSVDL